VLRVLERLKREREVREAAERAVSLHNIQERRGLMAPRVWGEMMLTIPAHDHAALVRANPDLAAPDGEIRLKAWKRFANSRESLPYRVSDNPHRRF
jgi:hypothetical protein